MTGMNDGRNDSQRPVGLGSGMSENPLGRSSWPESQSPPARPRLLLLGLAVSLALIAGIVLFTTVWA